MKAGFSIGDRVKISKDYHWAKNSIGEITQPPDYVVEMSDRWKGCVREVKYLNRVLNFHWVRFDQPQIDADGDGLYQEAAIDSDFLHLLNEKE